MLPKFELHPQNEDGIPLFNPSTIDRKWSPYYPGADDDVAAGTRGQNQDFCINLTGPTTHIQNFQFIDNIRITGGFVKIYGGGEGDKVDMKLVAPATPVASNPGAGNCDLIDTGAGFNIIVPANGDGSHDVDLTEALNANLASKNGEPALVTKATPVLAYNYNAKQYNGYYDYDEITGAIVASPSVKGNCNLYDAELPLVHWLRDWQLWDLGSGEVFDYVFNLPSEPKTLWPHWKIRVIWNIISSNNIKSTWSFLTARPETL